MAPVPTATEPHVTIADLKSKVVDGQVEIELDKPPVSEDYKYAFKYNHPLPTTDVLGVSIPQDMDAQKEAQGIVDNLSKVMGEGDAEGFANLFLEHGVWQDKLAYSWDLRTFNFRPAILKAANDLFPKTKATEFKFLNPSPVIKRPYSDYEYLQTIITFKTELITASAVVNSVLTKSGWKIYTMQSIAEQLNAFPEVAPDDGHMTDTISWEKRRTQEVNNASADVLIIGAGQNGLAVAARLKALGVSSVLVDRSAEIGDVWKKRYEYLSLHFPHWADDLPYFAYPKRWPTYTPAQKQGIYMDWYASALELNVWNKTTVESSEQDEKGNWTVVVNKAGETRTLHPKHVVMATSLCGNPLTPVIPGAENFNGVQIHSSSLTSSAEFAGKKVLVVGTSSSGFDTAYDCARRGIDVTLLQRSPTYVMSLTHSVPRGIGNYAPDEKGNRPLIEEQDRLFFANPIGPGEELSRRNTQVLYGLDRPLLEGLRARGLRTWAGQRGTGNATLGSTRGGGFYFDAGACKEVIEGRIKVEPGYIERFTEDTVVLNGGRERDFDVVIFATGFSGPIDSIRETLGEKIASQVGEIWGIDEEGEFNGIYKESGAKNLWIMVGALVMTRFYSNILALRLKALIEGIAPEPYKEKL